MLRYSYVRLKLIENQSLKQKKKVFEPREKIAPQHLFTAFLSNFKGRNDSIQSTPVLFFMRMTKSLVGFQVLNKVH